MGISREEVPFSDKDKLKIESKVSYFKTGVIVGILLILVGITLQFILDILFVSLLIGAIGIISTIVFTYSIKQIKNDMLSGYKTRIVGAIERLWIHKSGCSIVYKKLSDQRVEIIEKSAKGTTILNQNYVLGAGEKDMYYYKLLIGGEELIINRSDLLSIDAHDKIQIEYSKNKTVLSLKKID